MNTTMAANEQLLHQLNSEITQICPDIDYTKLHITIAGIISLYDIKLARLPGAHPDIRQKVDQFLATKKLEGLSELTLGGYQLELKIFARHLQKPLDQISASDIRLYLSSFPKLKMSSISRKLSVLKTFFGWLTDEELIPKDPVRKIKPPKTEQRLPKALTVEILYPKGDEILTDYLEKKYSGWVTKRGPSYYQAVLNLGPNPEKPGQYLTKSKTVRGSKSKAQKFLNDWIDELERKDKEEKEKKENPITDKTLGEWLTEWVEGSVKKDAEHNTYELYRWEIDKHIIPMIGHAPLTEVTPYDIHKFYEYKSNEGRLVEPKELAGDKKTPSGLSNRSVNLIHTVLNQAFIKAVALELIESNPCEKAKPPKDKKKKRKSENDYVALSKEQLQEFLKQAIDHRDFAIIYLAAYTGARQSELLGLRLDDDIWYEQNAVNIAMTLHRHKDGSFEHRPRTKNDSSTRIVDITSEDVKVLRWHEKKQKERQMLNRKTWKNEFNLVFTEPDGSPMDRRNLSKRFKNLAKKLGHPDFTFHGLRHTHATILLADGEYINAVSERLGHADIDTTLRIYGHVLPKMKEDLASRFARLTTSENKISDSLM